MLIVLTQETTIMQHFAKELGGIAAAIEHRYFGLSAPFGNDSYSRENIKYLTLDNTMADGVSFVDMIRSNVTGAHDSKVILASGGLLRSASLHRQWGG